MIDQLRSNKTVIALLLASVSLVFTWMELKSQVNSKRSELGHYVRNFTFSFIIVYSGLLIFSDSPSRVQQLPSIKQTHIMTGRPNF